MGLITQDEIWPAKLNRRLSWLYVEDDAESDAMLLPYCGSIGPF